MLYKCKPFNNIYFTSFDIGEIIIAVMPTLVTSGSMETGGAVTQTGHRVAELVGFCTLAHLVTVEPVGPRQTSCQGRGGLENDPSHVCDMCQSWWHFKTHNTN